jgi:hypothetical protein
LTVVICHLSLVICHLSIVMQIAFAALRSWAAIEGEFRPAVLH